MLKLNETLGKIVLGILIGWILGVVSVELTMLAQPVSAKVEVSSPTVAPTYKVDLVAYQPCNRDLNPNCYPATASNGIFEQIQAYNCQRAKVYFQFDSPKLHLYVGEKQIMGTTCQPDIGWIRFEWASFDKYRMLHYYYIVIREELVDLLWQYDQNIG